MAASFTIDDILTATRGALSQRGAWDAFCGVSTDSRTAQTGQIFIPLSGEHHDGHDFIPKALERGARGVLVERRCLTLHAPSIPAEITVIAINDALAALGDLAQAWRGRFAVPIVAVTGSCGKTTTKEMIAQVLSGVFCVHKNTLNLNNLIGLPLTLLDMEAAHDVAVVEMGMNRFGEIRRLTQIASPTVGVLTNVYGAHTEGLGDIAGVAQAKGEIIAALNSESRLVYNADDPWINDLARNFRGQTLSYGLKPGAALQAVQRRPQGPQGQSAVLHHRGQSWDLEVPAAGEHMLYNALAATAVGLALGLTPAATAAALKNFRPIARRSQVVTLPSGIQLLNDCYNANPGSMAMALKTLMELRDHGKTAAALGDMLELGAVAAEEHRKIGRLAAQYGVDYLVVYGNFRLEVAAGAREGGLSAARLFPVSHLSDAARVLQELLEPGDWLLVKGSRSMHMEGLVDLLELV
ncbi:MAG: UDP-N-acetylmuramoyl-tripeptide--D-alanyl-D-alanine ligase [Deltaproteobacteria bacterium]|nr:UDP-N-acetylmuramoyl-tripeptide--D-alanyl-D-alanine ligase [Deltaproteobacteria bacterium]